VPQQIIDSADFYFGWRGCDNHVSWLFRENMYHILNPCLKISTRFVCSSYSAVLLLIL
jgi:hypothetical protein